MPTSKDDFLKNRALAAAGARFFRFRHGSWKQKLIGSRSKDLVNMGSHLGIDFVLIEVDLGMGGQMDPCRGPGKLRKFLKSKIPEKSYTPTLFLKRNSMIQNQG